MGKYLILFLIACVAPLVCQACDPLWTSHSGSCYKYFFLREPWNKAKTYCQVQGAHLAIVMTAEENNFLKDLLRKSNIGSTDQVWMDGDDLKKEGSFVWEHTNETYLFEITNWGPNEPNQNGGNENCLSFYARYDFRWNDENCDSEFGFLCEKESATDGPGGVLG